jgi:predicted kinase
MEVVILMGLQASGKSHFCRRFEGTHRIVSKDLFPNARRPQERQMRMIMDALGAGISVVVDNTNPAVEDRRPIIQAARAAAASVIGYYLESSIDRSLALNAGRSGRKRVPDVGILSTVKRFTAPSMEEGFDRLYFVKMSPPDGFAVSEWVRP